MESEQPNTSEGYTTPVRTTEMIDPSQTLFHPVWRTLSGHDLFEKFNLN